MLINGEWRDSLSKASFTTVNPATEKVICQVAAGQKEDVDLAVDAATAALKGWAATPSSVRSLLLNKFADLIEANAKELALIESTDNGKSIAGASMDVVISTNLFRYYAGACDRIEGKYIPRD